MKNCWQQLEKTRREASYLLHPKEKSECRLADSRRVKMSSSRGDGGCYLSEYGHKLLSMSLDDGSDA